MVLLRPLLIIDTCAGLGVCLSPNGKLLARYGYGPEIKLLNTSNASTAVTLSNSVRMWPIHNPTHAHAQ